MKHLAELLACRLNKVYLLLFSLLDYSLYCHKMLILVSITIHVNSIIHSRWLLSVFEISLLEFYFSPQSSHCIYFDLDF